MIDDYPPALTHRDVGRPGQGWVGTDEPDTDPITVVEADPRWADHFAVEAARLRTALAGVAQRIEHVGSTSVPGLPAKPIIDIDVWVCDTTDEGRYVPALEDLGYVLVLREPWWNEHRMLTRADAPRVNLHVFPSTAPEPLRHLLFRDWLRSHEDDRDLYADAKRQIARATRERPEEYNLAKNEVIDDIYNHVFSVPPTAHPAWPTGTTEG
jgi:GrpB-like predicted nucleotidyltransferase (UPF0157 family)